jgi:hypothetical protein
MARVTTTPIIAGLLLLGACAEQPYYSQAPQAPVSADAAAVAGAIMMSQPPPPPYAPPPIVWPGPQQPYVTQMNYQ